MAPPEPLKPISKIALLPVVLQAKISSPKTDEYIADYAEKNAPAVVYQPAPSYVKGSPTAGIGAGIVAVGVAALVAHETEKSQITLSKAVSTINFQPVNILNSRLEQLLREKGLDIEVIAGADAVMEARREYDYSRVPTKADAVLDVRIGEYGYFHSMRAGGLSPMLSVNASLISPETSDRIESFDYWSDWRESKDDPRWITSPRSLIFKNAEDLENNAGVARKGLEKILEEIADQLVEDVRRRSLGQPAQ